MYGQQTFLYNGKRLRKDHPEEMPFKGGNVALCLYHRGGGSGTASMAMAVPIFEANNYGCGILWMCFLMSMHSVKRGLITEKVAAILLRTGRSSCGRYLLQA